MATDYKDYFNARINRELETNDSSYGASKFDALQRASQEKIASLEEMRLQRARIEATNKKSLVGRLGLDRDSFVGEAVDIGAATAAGIGSYVGTVGNAAATLAGNAETGREFQKAANLDEYVSTNDDGTKVSSLQRRAADVGISALKGAIAVPEMAVGLASMVSGGAAGKYLEEAGFRPEEAKAFLDTLRTHEQQAASQKVSGADGFWNTLGEIADNPSVVPHALMESLFPMLAGGLAGRGLAALGAGVRGAAAGGEGLVMAGSSAEQIRQNTEDGRLSFKQSLAAAGTGLLGAGVARLSGAAATRMGLGDIDQAIVEGTLGTSQRGLVARTIGSSAMEGGEETAQSAGEQMLQNVALDKNLTEGVGNASAMGLVTGLAMGTPMALAKGVSEVAEKAIKAASQQKVVEDAIASGDVSALLDKSKPAVYAPERAVAALVGIAKKADTTPEQKQESLDKANEIVTGLANDHMSLETMIEGNTPEGVQAQITDLKAQFADPANAADAADLQLLIKDLEASLPELADPKKVAAKNKQYTTMLAKIDKQLAEANKALAVLDAEVAKDEDVAALVATASQPVVATGDAAVDAQAQEQTSKAAVRVFAMAMRNPEKVTAEAALALANNTDNGLSDAQRNHLRVFNEARIAANAVRDLGAVSEEIYQGSADNMGLVDYRSNIPKALASGKRKQADNLLEKLADFNMSHDGKAAAVAQAVAVYEKSGKASVPVGVRKTDTGWEVGAPFASEEERVKNGGLNISGNSKKIIAAVTQESAAISKTLAEMQSAYSLQFNPGAKNVTNPPQQAAGSTGSQQTKATAPTEASAPAAVQAPVAGAVPGSESGNGGGTASTGSGQREQAAGVTLDGLQKVIDADTTYLTNPPSDYETKKASEIEAAAKTRVAQIDAAMEALPKGSEAREELADMKAANKRLLDKAVQVLEGDASLVEFEAAAPRVSNSTDAAESTVVESTPTVDVVEGSKESKESTTETVDTTQTTTPEESAEQTSEVADGEVKSAGVLSVFAEEVDFAAPYNMINLIAKYWKQSKGKAKDATLRPLAAIADFYSAWKADKSVVAQFLPTDLVLTEEQTNSINTFFKYYRWNTEGTAKAPGDLIAKLLPKMVSEDRLHFRHEDMMQFLLKDTAGKSDVDENVKVALAYVTYSWLVDKATSPRHLKNAGINALLLRKEDERVSPEMREAFKTAQTYQHTLADELGGKVLEALGLEDSKDTPLDQKARLRVALGAHAIKLMESRGLITKTTITSGKLRAFVETGWSAKKREKARAVRVAEFLAVPGNKAANFAAYEKERDSKEVYFYGISRTEEVKGDPDSGGVLPEIRTFYEASKGTQDVLGKLFKVASNERTPSLEPITKVPKTTAGTKQGVPSELQATIANDQQNAWNVRQDNMSLQSLLGEDTMLAMMGVVPEEDSLVHVSNRRSVKAKNDSLKRDYKLFTEYVGEYLATAKDRLNTPFYLPYVAWVNQRVGIGATVANPQASKYVRRMIGSPTWRTEIKSTNEDLMESFFLRVGEGLGEKTERRLNADARDRIESLLTDSVYAKAITALQKGLQWHNMTAGTRPDETTVLSDQEKAAIQAAVEKGGENMHSFDALVAVAHQRNAQQSALDNGQEDYTFTVELMGEVDGVANGTMLNHVLLGASNSMAQLRKFLEQGGFFSMGSKYKHYNEYRSTPGNKDVYESTGKILYEELKGLYGPAAERLSHIWNIVGQIVDTEGSTTSKGRSLIKDALNPLGFGSGIVNIRQKLSDTFIEAIYAGFEKMAQDGATQEEIDTYVGEINALLVNDKDKGILVGRPIDFYMNTEFSQAHIRILKQDYDSLVGEAMKRVVEQEFGAFIAARDALNNTASAVFGLYDAVKKGMREAYIKELMAAGELPVNSKGKQIGDLTQNQQDELDSRLVGLVPVMKSAMSKKDGNKSTNNGLLLADTERKQNKTGVYANRTKFGGDSPSMGIHGLSTSEKDIGVAAGSLATHSSDSGIISAVRRELPVLNGHDAAGAGVGQLKQAASLLNQNTWETLLNYSPIQEAFMSLSRVIQDIDQLIQNGNMPPEAIASLKAHLAKEAKTSKADPQDVLNNLLSSAAGYAQAADSNRLEFLSELEFLDQYAFNGGNYSVTDADRAKAVAMKGKSGVMTAADTQALKNLEAALYGKGSVDAAPTEASENLEPSFADGFAGEVDSQEDSGKPVKYDDEQVGSLAGAELGTPNIEADPDLAAYFKDNPKTTAKRVLTGLLRKYAKDKTLPNSEYYISLIGMLAGSVAADLPIQLITPETITAELLSEFQKNSRGWYVSKGTEEVIYVLSPEFKQSGLTPELLVHELTHAALFRIMQNASNDPVVAAQVARLQGLMNTAKARVDKQGLGEMFGAAFTNLDEFVTWGMTNPEFQRVVLTQMTVADTTTAATLKSGLTEFVKVISNLLFGSMRKAGDKVTQAKEGEINAMSALIQDVAALLHLAGNAKTTASTVTILSMASPVARVQNYSTHDINQALNTGGHDAVFQDQLSSVLDGIVTKLHGPVGSFKSALMEAQAGTPMDIWRKALDTGVAPFASSLLKAGLPISQQEAFVMEQVQATVAAALEDTSTTARTSYRELYRLYTEVAGKVQAKDFHNGDWAAATKNEKDAAQASFDAIFNVSASASGRSDYLSRFAAFGLAHEGFNKILQQATERDTRRVMDGKTFVERLRNIFDKVMGMFARKITKTYSGQNADTKLSALVSQLVDIEAKRKHTLAQQALRSTDPTTVDKVMAGAGEKVKDAAMWVVNTDLVKNSSSNAVRLAGSFVSMAAQNRFIQYVDAATRLRDMHYEGKPGVLAGLLNNVKGPKETLEFLVRMTKKNEKQRKNIMTNVAKFVREAYKDGGENLTKENKTAISNVFLRTGAYALVGRMKVLDLGNMLGDKAATNQVIADVEKELRALGKYSEHYLHQANGLAYYKATGKTNVEMLMMNAHNIAQMRGTPMEGRVNAAEADQAEKLIEQLVALYAIRYAKSTDVQNARELLRDELTRADGGNGVEFTLRMHEHQQQESLERLFKGNKTLMIHGYTPEIYNPNIEVVAASLKQGEELKYRGYEMVHLLPHDPADPDIQNEALYVLKDGGLSRFASGALSITGLASKGNSKHDGYLNTNNYYGGMNASTNAAFMAGKKQAIANSFKTGPVPDLSLSKKSFAAPVLNEKGEIVNWRYLMVDQTKDVVLERTNDFDQILGTLAGATYDKETSKEQNKGVLLALKEMFDAEYASQPYSYVAVSPKSDDPEMVEIWRMLSDATKAEAKVVFGEPVIYVRKDALDAIFGYRKMSLADAFKRDPKARNLAEKMMVGAVESMITLHYRMKGKDWAEAEKYAKRAAHIVTKNERIWQELVHEVKDIIVVKTGTVMVGNIWSNLSMLYLKGVPLLDILQHHATAFRGAVAYKKDTEQLERLRSLLSTEQFKTYQGGVAQIRRDMARLQDAIDRSPVKELMDAGLMPTIVEDVAEEDDQYSYKSALVRKVEGMIPARASLATKAVRQVYMAHDTPQYKFLAQTTQLSDFVARYTLYQHQISKKKEPLSKQAAIHEASETFVNYDLPMQRNMQYLDDMGLMPFMKYFLNIQRVLVKTMRENPARVLSLVALGNVVDLGPIVLSSTAIANVGDNPLQGGAIKIFTSFDDLATVGTAMALIK